ncbi:MAG: sialidase family protein [Bacteroidota bacterium]
MVSLPDEKLLAFCEGRLNGGSDFGNIDILMKTSINGQHILKYCSKAGHIIILLVDNTAHEAPLNKLLADRPAKKS